MRKRMLFVALITAICIAWLAIRWLNAQARPGHPLGARNGQLADCLDTPNCVSSTSRRPDQKLPPIPLNGSAQEARAKLASIIRAMPRSRIVTMDERYVHAKFRSRLFGFVDDVELLIDETNRVVHFRAAARVGYSDLGVNRRRIIEIREQFDSRHSNDN